MSGGPSTVALMRAAAAHPRRVVAGSAVVTALLVVVGLLVNDHAFEDLDVYRIGVRVWLAGGDMYGHLPPSLGGTSLPFIYPPFAALALSPFALLPWTASWIAMATMSMASLTATLYVTARIAFRGAVRTAALITAVALPLSLLLDPVAQTFWFGQVNLLLMGLVALDCLAQRPRWPRGALVGIAAAIKLTPAVFVLFLILRKDYRSTGNAVITFLVATGIGFLAAPGGSWTYFSGSASGFDALVGSPFASNQSIRGALARLHDLPPTAQAALWIVGGALALALAALAARRAFRHGRAGLAFGATAALGLLISPISWGHHWVYVAPAMMVMAALGGQGRMAAAAATAVVFVLHPYQFLPQYDDREFTWSWWQNLVGNAYGLVTFALLALLAWPELKSTFTRFRLRTRAPYAREQSGLAAPREPADVPGP